MPKPKKSHVKFAPVLPPSFYKVLSQRVDFYFKNQHRSKKSNALHVFKVLFFLALTILFYGLILSNQYSGFTLSLLFALLGISISIFLFSIAHDASHNAVSEKKWINNLFAYTWNLVGVTCYFWELKHNVSHHGFTNVTGKDEDIEQTPLLRLSPRAKRYKFHYFQHYYTLLLYSLLSFSIVYIRDIPLLFKNKYGNKIVAKHPPIEIFILILTKFIFVAYMVLIPKYVLDISWAHILGLHMLMHACIGLFIGFILGPVHVTSEAAYRNPDDNGIVNADWGTHQIECTVDFAADKYWVNWISGGLNTHVAHHLFPHINHIHYYEITKIIKSTAVEFGLPYRNYGLVEVFAKHLKFLKALGQNNNPTTNPVYSTMYNTV